MGEGRRKQETDTEDKTGKKVMICVIAKKMQWGQRGGQGGKTPESWYGLSYIVEATGQTTRSPSVGPSSAKSQEIQQLPFHPHI